VADSVVVHLEDSEDLAEEVSAEADLEEAGNIASLNTEINEENLESKYYYHCDFIGCLVFHVVFLETETIGFQTKSINEVDRAKRYHI
jgi:hypothetical protein